MEWSYTSASFVQKKVFVMTRICNPVTRERGMRKESLGVDVRLCLLSSGLMTISTLTRFEEDHTHALVTPSKQQFIRSNRKVTLRAKHTVHMP